MGQDWKAWIKAALTRAAKTFAQAAVSMITVGYGFKDIDWINVLSVSGVAAVVSIFTSLAGLPEVPKGCANGLSTKSGNDEIDKEAEAMINGI